MKPLDENDRETRRSSVRIWVTYGAAAFLFVVAPIFIGSLVYMGLWVEAKDLFLTILPVSAAIISYWFAGRRPENKTHGDNSNKSQDERPK